MSASEAGAEERPDLRLAPLVLGMWAALAAVLLLGPSRPLAWVLGSAVVGLLVLAGAVLARRHPSGHRTEGGRRPRGGGRAAPHGALVLVGLLLGVAIGGVHLQRLHPGVLAPAIDDAVVVRATAAVTGDPVVHMPADDGGRPWPPSWSVRAQVTSVTIRGRDYRLRVPAQLRGDEVQALRYGSQVSLTGRLQEAWAAHAQSLEIRVLGEVRVRSPPGLVARVTTHIRESFRAACSGLPRDAAALLLGLAVGDESLVSPELDAAMIRSGLAHLTAVSGSNTSLVVAIAMALVVGLGLGWRARVVLCGAVLWAYVLLVRPEPSVLRAAVMGVVALLALSTGGRRRGPPALLASALVLLIALPEFALSMGFALSFAATAGLLVVGPPIAGALARWGPTARVPEPVRLALAVAAAAHAATLPLVVLMGNGASLVALPANVLVTPLVPYATVLGLAAALLSCLSAPVAGALALAASPATALIARIAHASAGLRYGVIELPGGTWSALVTAAGVGLLGVGIARGWRPLRHRRALVAAAACGTLVVVGLRTRAASDWPPPGWVILACDVGQGDALLIRQTGSDDALLVDVGPDGGQVTDCLRSAQVQRVDILLTHFHADHIDGLAGVLSRFPVREILSTPVPEPTEGAAQVVSLAHATGVPLHLLRAGDRVTAGGVPLAILWPRRRIPQSPANNASVVALAAVATPRGPVTALLTGDIEPEAQSILLAGPSPAATVVKVPHHGSRYQVPRFAAWTGARIALVSVGQDNDYGHPSTATLAQYRDAGADIGRTDDQGDLAVVDGPEGPSLVSRR